MNPMQLSVAISYFCDQAVCPYCDTELCNNIRCPYCYITRNYLYNLNLCPECSIGELNTCVHNQCPECLCTLCECDNNEFQLMLEDLTDAFRKYEDICEAVYSVELSDKLDAIAAKHDRQQMKMSTLGSNSKAALPITTKKSSNKSHGYNKKTLPPTKPSNDLPKTNHTNSKINDRVVIPNAMVLSKDSQYLPLRGILLGTKPAPQPFCPGISSHIQGTIATCPFCTNHSSDMDGNN